MFFLYTTVVSRVKQRSSPEVHIRLLTGEDHESWPPSQEGSSTGDETKLLVPGGGPFLVLINPSYTDPMSSPSGLMRSLSSLMKPMASDRRRPASTVARVQKSTSRMATPQPVSLNVAGRVTMPTPTAVVTIAKTESHQLVFLESPCGRVLLEGRWADERPDPRRASLSVVECRKSGCVSPARAEADMAVFDSSSLTKLGEGSSC